MAFESSEHLVEMIKNPAQIEVFAKSLVPLCAEHSVDAVISIDNLIDAVIGHIVARELSLRHSSLSVDLGRLENQGEIQGHGAIVVIALMGQQFVKADALHHFLGTGGRKVVVVGLKDGSSIDGSLSVSVSP